MDAPHDREKGKLSFNATSKYENESRMAWSGCAEGQCFNRERTKE
jgi:hypothetical protein